MAPVKPCDVCATPSTNTCSKCKSAFYCSVAHQKLFWKYHRLVCGLDHENFTFIPMPDFQESEGKALVDEEVVKALQLAFPKAPPISSRSVKLKTDEESEEAIQKAVKVQNSYINKLTPKDRTDYLCFARYQMKSFMKRKTLQDRYEDPIAPFHAYSGYYYKIGTAGPEFHYPFFKQLFSLEQSNHELDILAGEFPTISDPHIREISTPAVTKLRKIYFELEREGKDEKSYYRSLVYLLAVRFKYDRGDISVDDVHIALASAGSMDKADADFYLLDL